MRERPRPVQAAIADARARGWRPTSGVHALVKGHRPARNAKASLRAASFVPVQHSESSSDGEIIVWDWDDGDPNNWEGTVYVESYYTGEIVYFDIQYYPTSDTDGFVQYNHLIDYDGGWNYDTNGGPYMVSGTRRSAPLIRRVQSGTTEQQRRTCLANCLRTKMETILRRTAYATGAPLIGCVTRWRAATPPTYLACVGLTGLAAVLFTSIDQFYFEKDCNSIC